VLDSSLVRALISLSPRMWRRASACAFSDLTPRNTSSGDDEGMRERVRKTNKRNSLVPFSFCFSALFSTLGISAYLEVFFPARKYVRVFSFRAFVTCTHGQHTQLRYHTRARMCTCRL